MSMWMSTRARASISCLLCIALIRPVLTVLFTVSLYWFFKCWIILASRLVLLLPPHGVLSMFSVSHSFAITRAPAVSSYNHHWIH